MTLFSDIFNISFKFSYESRHRDKYKFNTNKKPKYHSLGDKEYFLQSVTGKGGFPLFTIGNNYDSRVDLLRHKSWTKDVIYLRCSQEHVKNCKFFGKIHPIDEVFHYVDNRRDINLAPNVIESKILENGHKISKKNDALSCIPVKTSSTISNSLVFLEKKITYCSIGQLL